MNKKKSAIRAGAVLVVALAAGHLVQTMNAGKGIAAAEKPKAIEQVSAGPEVAAAPAPTLPASAALTAPTPAPTPEPAAPALAAVTEPAAAPIPEPTLAAADPVAPLPAPAAPEMAPKAAEAPADCALDLTLKAGPKAMIAIALTAPCRAGERVVLRHGGLAFAETLDAAGKLVLDLPALNVTGEVSVLFPDAEILRDAVAVPDAAATRRFAVQWMADDVFQLHAFEKGATYGEPGDVHAGQPLSPNGGQLVLLGDPTLDLPMLAEVYTWPADPAIAAEIVIESAVTQATCGRELLGETVVAQAGAVTVTDLTLAMPGCDAVGDILVLKNPGQGVTLAAN
jgi:hypothetical protein